MVPNPHPISSTFGLLVQPSGFLSLLPHLFCTKLLQGQTWAECPTCPHQKHVWLGLGSATPSFTSVLSFFRLRALLCLATHISPLLPGVLSSTSIVFHQFYHFYQGLWLFTQPFTPPFKSPTNCSSIICSIPSSSLGSSPLDGAI